MRSHEYRRLWSAGRVAIAVTITLPLTAVLVEGRQAPVAAGQVAERSAVAAAPEQTQLGQPQAPPKALSAKRPPSKVARWLDLQAAAVSLRYRYVDTSKDVVTARQMQDSVALRARVKFDPDGKYSLTAGVATGASFTGGWNTTGVGTGDFAKDLHVKHFFASAAPVKGVEVNAGSMAFVRGESTEITSYDNDGYVTGERVTVKRPKDFYLDEVSTTVGYLGDLNEVNFFTRADRLGDWNYWQVFGAKKIGKQVVISTDLVRATGVETLRSAVSAKTPDLRVIDAVRWEQYKRFGQTAAFGFAIYGEKAVHKRVTVGGGYADIDAKYGGLNADRFNKGRRIFSSGSVKVVKDLQVQYFLTRAVANDFAVSNKTRFDLILAYNAVPALGKVLFAR